jgi:hypothetical protein
MLSQSLSASLVSLLSNETDPLSSLSTQFCSTFDVPSRMTALMGLSMLFADGLLDHKQQIVALWLLFNEFQSIPLADNPFLPIFSYLSDLRATSPNSCSPQLYDIISCILGNFSPEKLGDLSVRTIFSPGHTIQTPKAINIPILKPSQARISHVLIEQSESPMGVLTQPQVLSELLADPALYADFEAPFVRPAPAVSPLFQGELFDSFISCAGTPSCLWDDGV